MNTPLAALFLALPISAFAVDAPLGFPDAKIDVPPLSLVENSLQRPRPGFVSDFGRQPTPTVVVSKMPILVPDGAIDPKFVKEPDSTVDYKLIIKSPFIEPSK
jgi:hypothetical protein